MVLEHIFSAKAIERKPMKMGILGVLIPSICIFVTRMFGDAQNGLILVFLIAIAMIPLMVKLMYIEEKRDIRLKEYSFWERHGNVMEAYSVYFVAVALTLSLWYFFLPQSFADTMFSDQLSEIDQIRTGNFAIDYATAWDIMKNNVYVMLISFITSFLFASGAIFILTWNASVLGVVIGQLSRHEFGSLVGIPLSFAGFAPHGIPEVFSYFLAGLAGGILSRAVEKHQFLSENFKIVLWDATKIFLGALLLIGIAGLIEGWILSV